MNYGVHWLLNVLVKGEGMPGLILFRALHPTRGIRVDETWRALDEQRRRLSVQGRKAFGSSRCPGDGARHRPLRDAGPLSGAPHRTGSTVVTDVRIGISKSAHLPWRFLLEESPHLSVKLGSRTPGRRFGPKSSAPFENDKGLGRILRPAWPLRIRGRV